LRRETTGFIALGIFLACVFWRQGQWLSAAVAGVSFFFAQTELYDLLGVSRRPALMAWQNLLALLFFACSALHFVPGLIVILFLFFWGSCLISMSRAVEGSRHEIAAHGLLLIYLLIPLSSYIYLRSIAGGPYYLFFMLTVACMTDTGAYYGGKLLGRHKLAPVISPNKTWEGSICGAMAALILIFIVAIIQSVWLGNTLWLPGAHRYIHIGVVAILLSAIGQIGDLCESAMKRDAGIKDSGVTNTGHGGFLDMMDAMLWIGPAMYVYVVSFN
jgi:phosphatidate cytidylyltransferase